MHNTKKVSILLLALCLAAPSAFARTAHKKKHVVVEEEDSSSYETPGPFALGLTIGTVFGLNAKYWFSSTSAIDGGLGYSFWGPFEVYADYQYHFKHAFGTRDEFARGLTPYIGGGGSLGFGWWVHGAVRADLGIEWRPAHPNIGVFVDFQPGIGFGQWYLSNVYPSFEGALGLRFYFAK